MGRSGPGVRDGGALRFRTAVPVAAALRDPAESHSNPESTVLADV